jgi:hypothetical protein
MVIPKYQSAKKPKLTKSSQVLGYNGAISLKFQADVVTKLTMMPLKEKLDAGSNAKTSALDGVSGNRRTADARCAAVHFVV